jgi:hypothetical protein
MSMVRQFDRLTKKVASRFGGMSPNAAGVDVGKRDEEASEPGSGHFDQRELAGQLSGFVACFQKMASMAQPLGCSS